jgi:hypothetical protein
VAAGEDVSRLWRLPASRLAALYRSGEATPLDCLDALLERI